MFLFTPQAQKDLQDILEYLSEKDKEVAHKIRKAIITTCKLLGSNNYLGVEVKHSKVKGVRYLTCIKYDQYIIFYRIKNKQIEIIRFSHHARNWIKLLSSF